MPVNTSKQSNIALDLAKKIIAKHYPVLIYLLISICIMFPLYDRGFILHFDMVFTPNMEPGEPFSIFSVHRYIIFLLAQFFTGELLQKLVLTGIFILMGCTAFNLIKLITKHTPVALIAGIFYTINPFVYERFVAGQWLFLLGYVATPLFLELTITLFYKKTQELKDFVPLIGLWFVVTLFSQHHFLLFGLIFLFISAFQTIRELQLWKSIKKLSPAVSYSLIINFFWLVVLLQYSKDLAFNSEELLLFSTGTYKDLGLLGNLLTMNGFWAQRELFGHIFDLNNFGMYLWFFTFIIFLLGLFILVLPRTFTLYCRLRHKLTKADHRSIKAIRTFPVFKNNHFYLWAIIAFTAFGLMFSMGSNGFIGTIYQYLIDDLPFLRGMREPQKFLSLYVLGYIIFFSLGITSLIEILEFIYTQLNVPKTLHFLIKKSLMLILVILIIGISFPIFFGADHQLKVTKYPEIYYTFDDLIKKQNTTVLVFPWQAYANFEWADSRFAIPADRFFKGEIIQRQDVSRIRNEFCDIEFVIDTNFNDGSKYKQCFRFEDDPAIFHKTLRLTGIDYIMVVNSDNSPKELQLIDKKFFELILEDETTQIFKVRDIENNFV